MNLNGKTALVTGAAAGLGKAIALTFARSGARLVICDINDGGLADTTKAIEALGAECLALRCDVSSSTQVATMFAKACDRFGTVHVLVNNAAMVPEQRPDDEARRNKHYAYLTTPMPRQSLGFTSNLSDEEWLRFWDVNVHGVFYCTREALRRMEPQRDGKIINIASIAGIRHSVPIARITPPRRELSPRLHGRLRPRWGAPISWSMRSHPVACIRRNLNLI